MSWHYPFTPGRIDKQKSKYRGVVWEPSHQKWRGRIMINRKAISLGLFDSEEEASQAYNQARAANPVMPPPPQTHEPWKSSLPPTPQGEPMQLHDAIRLLAFWGQHVGPARKRMFKEICDIMRTQRSEIKVLQATVASLQKRLNPPPPPPSPPRHPNEAQEWNPDEIT